MLSIQALQNLAGNLQPILRTHAFLHHKLGESSQMTTLQTRKV